jgi:hypothetical protein
MRKENMTNSLEKAESTVAQLEQKRSACVRRGTELADERSALAFAAHAFIDAQRFNADRPESRSALGYAMQAPC